MEKQEHVLALSPDAFMRILDAKQKHAELKQRYFEIKASEASNEDIVAARRVWFEAAEQLLALLETR